MKNFISLSLLIFIAIQLFAWDSPISIPDIGVGHLRVIGQNSHNYYLDLTNSFSSSSTEAELLEKTDKMANTFVALNADIVALCEVEDCDSILGLLTAHMNSVYGQSVYRYIADGGSSTYTKCGFVYRKDKVEPYNAMYSASPYSTVYEKRLRIQCFKELSSGEMFTLSMNHFKAKVNSSDEGESQRLTNANDVINTLKTTCYDPDVLLMGDLNAYPGESCIILLENAGYAEQLLRFDSNAYSYYYQGSYGLLDHAMANSTMANQITGAQVYHINTLGYYDYKYSDHDCCMVGLDLGGLTPPPTPPVECPVFEYDFREGFNGFNTVDISGNVYWQSSTSYGATINSYKKEDNQEHWLISPALDLSKAETAELTINHCIYYDNGVTGDYWSDQTVWVSTDYVDGNLPSSATWQQIVLSDYPYKNYGDAVATIPSSFLKNGMHLAFKYVTPLAENSNYWEIKTAKIQTTCSGVETATEDIQPAQPAARKILYSGRIYIEYNGQVFDMMGNRLK